MPFKDAEKYKQYQTEYRNKNTMIDKTPKRIKYFRIHNWKKRGVIFCDYDLLYDIFINTTHCDLCKVELSDDVERTSNTRCLDHDHTITDCENVRNVLCHLCNRKRN